MLLIKSYNVCVMWSQTWTTSLADPGGAHPARAPLNGRGPMIFLCPKRQFFSFFPRSLRSQFTLSLILIDIWPNHAKNWLLLQTVNTFNYLLSPLLMAPVLTPLMAANMASGEYFARFLHWCCVVIVLLNLQNKISIELNNITEMWIK